MSTGKPVNRPNPGAQAQRGKSPGVSRVSGAGTLREAAKGPKTRAVMFKQYLNSPLHVKWDPIAEAQEREVLSCLQRDVRQFLEQQAPPEVKKPPPPPTPLFSTNTPLTVQVPALSAASSAPAPPSNADEAKSPAGKTAKRKRKDRVSKAESSAPKRPSPAKFGLCVGVNAVTRALEHDQLSLFIVSKDVKPLALISHFPSLSVVKQVPMIVLATPTPALGQVLSVRSIMALGFKRDTKFTAAAQSLRSFASIPSVPLLDISVAVPSDPSTQSSAAVSSAPSAPSSSPSAPAPMGVDLDSAPSSVAASALSPPIAISRVRWGRKRSDTHKRKGRYSFEVNVAAQHTVPPAPVASAAESDMKREYFAQMSWTARGPSRDLQEEADKKERKNKARALKKQAVAKPKQPSESKQPAPANQPKKGANPSAPAAAGPSASQTSQKQTNKPGQPAAASSSAPSNSEGNRKRGRSVGKNG